MVKKFITSITALLAIFASTSVYAQSYDDDDIYYNPSKTKKATNTTKKTTTTGQYRYNTYQPSQSSDYNAADTYTPSTTPGVNMSVDEYNRRGFFGTGDANATSDSLQPDFQATRQIEKFYNPDIVTESNDQNLAEYYYSQPTSTVNIILNDYPYYSNYWGYPYYSTYWSWGYPYYRPWSYYSWNYGWGPSYSWAWSPAWGWNYGWGPSYWGPSYGWGYPSRPVNTRPGSVGNVRPGYRPGTSHAGTATVRPGDSSAGYRPGTASTGGYRPGNSSADGYRPGRVSTGNVRGNAPNSNSTNGSYRYNNAGTNNSNSNNNTGYRPNTSSAHSSWGSSSSGGFRGSSSSGGIRSGGGRGRH